MYDAAFGADLQVLQRFVARHAVDAHRPLAGMLEAIEREMAAGSSGGS